MNTLSEVLMAVEKRGRGHIWVDSSGLIYEYFDFDIERALALAETDHRWDLKKDFSGQTTELQEYIRQRI